MASKNRNRNHSAGNTATADVPASPTANENTPATPPVAPVAPAVAAPVVNDSATTPVPAILSEAESDAAKMKQLEEQAKLLVIEREQKAAEIQREMETIKQREELRRNQRVMQVARDIDALTLAFGVSTIKDVIGVLRNRMKGRVTFEGKNYRIEGDTVKPWKLSNSADGRGTRARITPEVRKSIEKALKAENQTSAEIAEANGVSVPSVQAIKKDLGLVKARK